MDCDSSHENPESEFPLSLYLLTTTERAEVDDGGRHQRRHYAYSFSSDNGKNRDMVYEYFWTSADWMRRLGDHDSPFRHSRRNVANRNWGLPRIRGSYAAPEGPG